MPPENDATYWIPGAKLAKASRPVPDSGSTTAMPDLDLMYLGAYAATRHDVSFGVSADALHHICSHAHDENVCKPPQPLLTGITYYWRVDDADGQVGDLWSFSLLERVLQVVVPRADSHWQLSDPTKDFSTWNRLVIFTATNPANSVIAGVQFEFGALATPRVRAFTDLGCHMSIDSAKLGFRVRGDDIEGLVIHAAESHWQEPTTTGPPLLVSQPAASLHGTLHTQTVYEIDVTGLVVAAFVGGAENVSFGLRTNHTSPWTLSIDSKECSESFCVPPHLSLNLSFTCSESPPVPPASPVPPALAGLGWRWPEGAPHDAASARSTTCLNDVRKELRSTPSSEWWGQAGEFARVAARRWPARGAGGGTRRLARAYLLLQHLDVRLEHVSLFLRLAEGAARKR